MENSPALVTAYEYNAVNSRIKVTDPRNLITTFGYDALQRLINKTEPCQPDTLLPSAPTGFQATTLYEYGANSGGSLFESSSFKPTRVTDPRGHIEDAVYDPLYRPLQVTRSSTPSPVDEPPAVNIYEYDEVGNARFVTDPLGNRTETVYDALNRAVRVNYVDGTYARTLYTSTGLKWKIIDELFNETETRYDGAGRLIQTFGPAPDPKNAPGVRPLTQTVPDPNGNVAAVIDPLLNETDYNFDWRNRKTDEYQPAVADYDSGTTQRPHLIWAYDGVGNVIATTDARQNCTATLYDWANRPVQVTAPSVPVIQPDGSTAWAQPVTSTVYDEDGNALTVTDANTHGTVNTYTNRNQLWTTTDAETDTVTCGYDPVGNRTSVQDGDLQTTHFDYDGMGRNVTATDAQNQVTAFTYNALNKEWRLDANGQHTHYLYDHRNRLQNVQYPDHPEQNRTYAYDPAGHLLSVTDDNGNAATAAAYTYDGLGRILTETSNRATHAYIYDLAGNRRRAQYGLLGGGYGRLLVSDYDFLNRLLTLTDGANVTTYHYDLSGHVRAKDLPSGEREVTDYDALGRQEDSTDAAGGSGSVLYAYNYGHDAGGNLRLLAEYKPGLAAATRTTILGYDSADRLKTETVYNGTDTSAAATPAASTTYGYDAADNRTSRSVAGGAAATFNFNNLNQLTGWLDTANHNVSYTYDSNGNRLTRTEGTATDAYAYDLENRLVSLDKGGAHYAYAYDYRTRRVGRTEGPNAAQVVYSGGVSVAEYAGADASATLGVEFVRGSNWGGGVGGLLYSVRGGNTSLDHYDARGDVATQTNGSGTISYQAGYEAWGTRTQEFGQDQDRQRANTKEEDPTGLLNEGQRNRDLETATFTTRDPLGMVDGPNLYAYVRDNPWSKFDPEGLEEKELGTVYTMVNHRTKEY